MRRSIPWAAALLLAAACQGKADRVEAEQAVRTYVARIVDAYRTSDPSLMDPLVNEQQGLRLTGLIGVKRDAGVVLDARLLEIQFTRAERAGDRWVVETRESWYYRDRRIGTGEQVGQDSTDSYAMRYQFSRKQGRLVLEELEFAAPPQVGRKEAPMPVDPRILHGLAGEPPQPPAGHPPVPARPPAAAQEKRP